MRLVRPDGVPVEVELYGTYVTYKGRPAVQVFARDMSLRKQALQALRDKRTHSEAITQALTLFLESGDWKRASRQMVEAAIARTESRLGFAAVVADGKSLCLLAHKGLLWNTNANSEDSAAHSHTDMDCMELAHLDRMFRQCYHDGKIILSNDSASDPQYEDFPAAEPPLRNLLAIPLFRENEVVGIIGLGNRPGGYDASHPQRLELLSQATAVLYDSFRRRRRETELEEQFLHSQKMESIGRLAGGVAHDFNNLLTSIMGYADLLKAQIRPEETARQSVQEIRHAAERAADLTRQLLAFSRRQILQPRRVDLNHVVADMQRMLARLLGEDIELCSLPSPEPAAVEADPGQIEQVVMNLAVNARDAMPDGGTLTIQTSNLELAASDSQRLPGLRPGAYVELSVADTGVGMDERTLAHAFEPFFTTKVRGKGTGLGLSTVYGIIRQSGGTVRVHSEPGEGTRVSVFLPRCAKQTEAIAAGTTCPLGSDGAETVLLVEDEAAVRALVREVLEMNGYVVLEAADGKAAMKLATRTRHHIDLLLTDVVMPQMSGRELAERLTAQRPDLRVLYMSGYTPESVLRNGLVPEGTAFMCKPFTVPELARKLREVLESPQPRSADVRGESGGAGI
jgi:signal transduction histidine kinase/ActR/RegA family two-component response regulator